MAYADRSNRPSAAGLTAAVTIQGGIVAALIVGLSVTTGVIERPENMPVFDIPKEMPKPPPPPEVEPTVEPTNTAPSSPPSTAPRSRVDLADNSNTAIVQDVILPPLPPAPIPRPTERIIPTPKPTLTPTAQFDPVPARPRNDPGGWVTTNDYRSAWIRRELTGTAQFRLQIAASGKVVGCTITASSGHSALDDATCSLISKRARFEPARDTSGDAVVGSYSSALRWDLPE